MERIKSFEIDHNSLEPGIYLSRVDGDVNTYDIRFIKPNQGVYLDYDGIHSLEHILATRLRNTKEKDSILYVGPMGCRTGFYLLTRNVLSHQQVINLIIESLLFISQYEGQVPGASQIECGNYLEHDLDKAKQYAFDLYQKIKTWQLNQLTY